MIGSARTYNASSKPPQKAVSSNVKKPGAKKEKAKAPYVPEMIVDVDNNTSYKRGDFLGKGGFAHCYALRCQSNGEQFAGKIVPKTLLVKQYQRDKMAQEVQIQRSLVHPNVVKLYHFFEDRHNVYITLELCSNSSLMELHRRRKVLTEPEARYYIHQIGDAIDYLHNLKIIHRDLKLGNLFLNCELQVKIGDFGLATIVDPYERKKTFCGTPNYLAPEVLQKTGHSFEVDIWAVGCILYILLFGHPPFQAESLEDTYEKIKRNHYTMPKTGSPQATQLVRQLLSAAPSKRPTAKELLQHPFFTSGYMPQRLPRSCLVMAPKFGQTNSSMMIVDENVPQSLPAGLSSKVFQGRDGNAGMSDNMGLENIPPTLHRKPMTKLEADLAAAAAAAEVSKVVPDDAYLSELYAQVSHLLSMKLPELDEQDAMSDDYQSPEALPIFWVSKWVDYSDKYGIGYQLCDNSVGVLFNDNTRIMVDEAGNELTYIEKNNREHYFQLNNHVPTVLTKKVTLLKYFRSYMNDHLLKAGDGAERKEGDDLARLPTLRVWFRTKSAIILHLSSGTVQINFFNDHIKMMMCPLMQAVTFIDQQKRIFTYKFANLTNNGCSEKFLSRIRYAKTMIERLLAGTNTMSSGCSSGDMRSRSASANGRTPASQDQFAPGSRRF